MEKVSPAVAVTVVVAVALLLPGTGSVVAAETVAVLEIVEPSATEAETATVSVKTALPRAMEGLEHETVPPAKTPGVVQLQPMAASETKVVPDGSVSVIVTPVAVLGPVLPTTRV